MQCHTCRNEAAFFQSCSGRNLCSRHLVLDIDARAKRTIRTHRWMSPGDHIAVVLTGDKKSAALALFLKKLLYDRRDIRLSPLPAGVCDTGGCSRSPVPEACGISGVPPSGIPAPGGHGTAVPDRPTKIALAFTLDDMAREVLVRFLFGNVEDLIRPPPAVTGATPVICPFIAIPSEELEIYLVSQETGTDAASSPPMLDPLSREVENLFCKYHRRHPATRFALLNLAEDLSSGGLAGIAAAAVFRTGSESQELP